MHVPSMPTAMFSSSVRSHRFGAGRVADPVGHARETRRQDSAGGERRRVRLQCKACTLELYRQISAPMPSSPADGRWPPSGSGRRATRYRAPFSARWAQDEHEVLLIDRLAQAGVVVERETEFVAFEEATNRILAQLQRGG